MINKRNIILSALLVSLITGTGNANTSNDLLKMDIKKSSATDAVDVTFYTTGGSTNSVVTRKSDNRYVVLLPNVAGSPSVAPNIGGVKDLITNIDVKNVNDGIGGYTKVTFTTSKPVRIQTAMKKTAPLTKAQEDYKNLIAQNKNTKPITQTKQAPNPTAKQPVNTTSQKPAVKPNTTQVPKADIKPSQKTKDVKSNTPTKNTAPVKPKIDNKPLKQPEKVTPVVNPVQKTETKQVSAESPKSQTNSAPVQVQENKTANNTQNQNKKSSKSSLWMLILSAFAGLITLNIISKIVLGRKKNVTLNQPISETVDSQVEAQKKYSEILNDESLSWQEKYNRYSEINESENSETNLSYVTSAQTQNAVLTQEQKHAYTVNEIKTEENISALQSLPNVQNNKVKEKQRKLSFRNIIRNSSANKEEILKDELRAKISQMEHSLAQTPKLELPSEYKKDVYSENDTIAKKLSDIKLKSFAQPSLNSTHRMLLGAERRPVDDIKEGRFVRLKNSPLNISTRKSASSKINRSNYYKNHGEMNMDKMDNYNVSSLNEYFSILDSEEKASNYFSKPAEVVDGRVSNPIKANNNISATYKLNGMIVRSSYSIDSQKGFYIVDMDSKSALVGRINDNVFILKKFDEIIDKNLQVRLDSGSTYIVKAGKYKCLVDVSKDRMGTLIEI